MRTPISALRLGLLSMIVLAATLLIVPSSAVALSDQSERARIVFSNGGRILQMNADGSEREVLFGKDRRPDNAGYGAIEPDVSDDGEKIVFSFRREFEYDGLTDIWVMNSDGSGAEKLLISNRNQRYGDPEFAPDGRIVVASLSTSPRRANARIISLKPDGTAAKTLYRLAQRLRPWVGWKNLAEPSVSPDGKRLLYLLDEGYDGIFVEGSYGSELRVLNLGSGTSRLISEHAIDGDWSPDGKRIAFSEVDSEGDNEFCWTSEYSCRNFSRIRIANANGQESRLLTGRVSGRSDERRANWSASGRIVFQSTRGPKRDIAETTEIWSVRPDGKCLTRLTNGSPASLSPVLVASVGNSTGPSKCQGRPPGPNVEMAAASGSGMFWLGKSYRNVLLSATETETSGDSPYFLYGDCGAIPASKCGREVVVYNVDICEMRGYAAAIIGSGIIQEQRGIPILRSLKPGRETPPYTMGFSGRTVFFMYGGSGVGKPGEQNRREIDALRRVGSEVATGDLAAPKFPAGDIRRMKRVERVYRRTDSVSRTAELLEMKGYVVRGNLRLARKFRSAGGYETVRCPKGAGRQ